MRMDQIETENPNILCDILDVLLYILLESSKTAWLGILLVFTEKGFDLSTKIFLYFSGEMTKYIFEYAAEIVIAGKTGLHGGLFNRHIFFTKQIKSTKNTFQVYKSRGRNAQFFFKQIINVFGRITHMACNILPVNRPVYVDSELLHFKVKPIVL